MKTYRVFMDGQWHTLPVGTCELHWVPIAECSDPECSHVTDEYQPGYDPEAETVDEVAA